MRANALALALILARDMERKDAKSFWRNVSKVHNSKLPLPTVVNGCSGEKDITNMWKEHYDGILNSVKSEKYKVSVIKNW